MAVIIRLISSLIILVGLSAPAFALDPVYKDFFGNAIKGYDPVAYFTQSKAIKGERDYQFKWKDATWYFSSNENRLAFIEDPQKYAPQYGGYCAWAVSRGYTAKIDPNAWRIVEGKLYLNYSLSVQATWAENIPQNVARANKNWPALLANK